VTTTDDRTQQRNKAIDLHLAGLSPVKKIAEHIGTTLPPPGASSRRAWPSGSATRSCRTTSTEIARIDALIAGLWAQPARATKTRSTGWPSSWNAGPSSSPPARTSTRCATPSTSTVELSKEIKDVDAGAVQLGREYADRIDEAIATSEGQELTKALYLGPHILGVFRELLATPAARAAPTGATTTTSAASSSTSVRRSQPGAQAPDMTPPAVTPESG
jgi:hypothetical protein